MKTIDISGMGGGYELVCQKMLQQGVQFLNNNPGLTYDFKTFENVYGIISPESENAKKLEAAILVGQDDVTGAMVQAVIGNLLYINKFGYEKFLKVASEDDPDRLYEFDGTINSVPKTDLSESIESRGH